MGYFKDVGKRWQASAKKINWDGKNNAALFGGVAGSALGPIGILGGSLLADKLAGNSHLTDQLKSGFGGSKKEKATYGTEMPTPVLSPYKGIESIRAEGNLKEGGMIEPRMLTGADISKQMEESPWYKMALQNQAAEQALRMGQGVQQSAAGAAQARAGLAARGGLRGGAAERLAQRAGENMLTTKQNILGQGAVERSGIGMQAADLGSRIGQFNVNQGTAADVQNLRTNLLNLDAQEKRKLFEYGEGMKMKGAGMTAQATENAGKK